MHGAPGALGMIRSRRGWGGVTGRRGQGLVDERFCFQKVQSEKSFRIFFDRGIIQILLIQCRSEAGECFATGARAFVSIQFAIEYPNGGFFFSLLPSPSPLLFSLTTIMQLLRKRAVFQEVNGEVLLYHLFLRRFLEERCF